MVTPASRMRPRASAVKIALTYAGISALWILISDSLVHGLVADPTLRTYVEMFKGWFFVASTAFLLWLALDWHMRRQWRSTEQLEEAQRAARLGNWSVDFATGTLQWSQEHFRIFEVDPGAFRGAHQDFLDRVHPEDRERVRQANEAARTQPKPVEVEYRIVTGSGAVKVLRSVACPRKDREGRLLGLHGTTQDITAYKQLEESLRASEELYRLIYAHSGEAMFLGTPAGAILSANPAACRLFRCHEADLQRWGRAALQPAGDPRWESALQQRDREGRVTAELPFLRPDGTRFEGEVTSRIFQAADGELRTTVLIRDVTERKRQQRHDQREVHRTELLLQLHQQAPQMQLREVFEVVLEKAMRLTDSESGFFYRVAEDQNAIVLTTWRDVGRREDPASAGSPCPVADAGRWADCVRHQRPIVENDGARSPDACGLPPGHTPLRRFLRLPVVEDGQVRLLLGVGNKAEDYDDEDLTQLQLVAAELGKLILQRRIQDQLRLLSRAVDQSPTSIVITNHEGAIAYVNPKFTVLTGYSLDEVRGQNPRVLRAGDLPPDHYRDLWETITAGREWRGELHNRKKNGEDFWELATISAVKDAEGRTTHYVAVKEDITANKRLENFRQALLSLGAALNQASDARSAGHALLQAADQLWAWHSATLDFIKPNRDGIETILNIDTIEGRRQEIPATPGQRLTPRIERVLHEGALLIRREDPLHPEFPSVPFGDTTRLSATIMTVPIRRNGETVAVLSIQSYDRHAYTAEDLKTLQALADYCGGALERIRSEEQFRTLVENAPIGIFLQAEGRFSYLNQAAIRMFGAGAHDRLIGAPVLERFHPDVHVQVEARMRQLNVDRRAVPLAEERCVRLDGAEFTGEFFAVPFLIEGQSGALVFFQDVTARKQLEIHLRQAQKLEAIGQLAGGVAHDFNNILAAIMMHLGLLKMNRALDRETVQALDDVESEARRAASLTRQLLMFSRRSVLSMSALDLNQVIANVLRMLTRLIGEQVRLRFEAGSNLPAVHADAGMMEQVLMNLVVNARDAMPKGGLITISTSAVTLDAEAAARHQGGRPGHFVRLEVADTGTGMDQATVRHIFEPFFTTKEAGKGTGLGLATVHGIVAQHEGWIEVESEPDHGSTFLVYLPIAATPTAPTAGSEDLESVAGGHETILLVEDDRDVRRSVARTLTRLGYQVHEAGNGREALALWAAHGARIDLLLTDMVMPEGMSGLELIQELQTLRPSLKAIIASGYSAEIAQAGAPNRPGVHYLPKPFAAPALARFVRQCLDQASHC